MDISKFSNTKNVSAAHMFMLEIIVANSKILSLKQKKFSSNIIKSDYFAYLHHLKDNNACLETTYTLLNSLFPMGNPSFDLQELFSGISEKIKTTTSRSAPNAAKLSAEAKRMQLRFKPKQLCVFFVSSVFWNAATTNYNWNFWLEAICASSRASLHERRRAEMRAV